MTDRTIAELIAEAKSRAELCDADTREAVRDTGNIVARLAAALEATEQERDEAREAAEDHVLDAEATYERMDLRVRKAEHARDQLAAVVEKALSHDPLHGADSGLHCGGMAPCIRDILATAPADALREVKAEAWDEGSETGFTHGMSYQAGNNSAMNYRNPYRQAKSVLMTHPHDGHGLGDTCLDCQRREEKG